MKTAMTIAAYACCGSIALAQADIGRPREFAERYRPQFHYTTAKGWINDPIGLIYYDGEYHLFNDHNVKSTRFPGGKLDGEQSHWSHAVSNDLIHWRHMPVAVYPDKWGACWSGSGVVDWHNTTGFKTSDHPPLVLAYTSAGSWGQSLVYSTDRGRTWKKYDGNPVLKKIADHNRDPMVFWHEPTKKWVMVLYVKRGQAHFFNSDDLKKWMPTSVAVLSGFHECPDMFQLPVDGDRKKLKWVLHDGRFSYWIGEFDGKAFKPETKELRCEFGRNFHAAQSWETPQNKRVQIGWMNGGKYPGMPFNQQQSFPCELTLRTTPAGLRLHMVPIEGIKRLYTSSFTLKDHVLKPGHNPLSRLSGDLFDIAMDVEIGKAAEFGLRLHETSVTYADGKVTSLGAVAKVSAKQGRIRLRILVDRTSVETFVNDGEVALPCCFVPKNRETRLELYAKGGNAKIRSLRVSKLRSIWPADAGNKVLLDFNMKTRPPKDWDVTGYAFGTHEPEPRYRQRAAVAPRNQRRYQRGRMISPEFVINHDYLRVVCGGVFHPARCAVVLVVDGKDARSCSPERGCGFLGFDASPGSPPAPVKLFRLPVPAEYWFDLRALRGKRATIEVRDDHSNGYFSAVKVVATDHRPSADAKLVTEAVHWVPDRWEATIDGDFLLLPVGALAGTPLQAVTVEIDGRELLKVALPLAFGLIPVVGYLPVYDLTGFQGKPLKVSFHSYTGHDPSRPSVKLLMQREIPGRKASGDKPAFHIHNRIGLLNDPNGLVHVKGVYHVFHQFNYNVTACSWAHYTSRDLVHWEERPVGLWHDEMGSMHSGSAAVAAVNPAGGQKGGIPPGIAAYTGSRGLGGRDKIQVQGIAYSTDGGRTFTKFKGTPVLGKSQVLARGSDNARDPKVFWFSPTKGRDPRAKDGHWVMVLFEGGGLNIYTSKNLCDWHRHGSIPGFHECPELFPLAVDPPSPDGSATASGKPRKIKWIMYGGSGHYHIGAFDGKTFKPQTKQKLAMYHDGRCYAAQTFNNTPPGPDGQPRRIQIGWQGGRRGQLSTPTELTLRTTPLGLRVCKMPVKELAKLRTRTLTLDGTKLAPGAANPLAGLRGGLYDIELEADLSRADRLVLDLRGVKLTVAASKDGLKLGRMKIPHTRKLSLRLLVDNTSLDVYFGEHGVYYSPKMIKPKSKTISIEAVGGTVFFTTLRGHELKSIW